MPPTIVAAAAPPSTSLGPWVDSAVAWTTWVTLMGFVGLTVLALAVGLPAQRASPGTLARSTARLARTAVVLSVLAVPAVLTSLAQEASGAGGYDYAAAWRTLYDGSAAGLLSGLEVTFSLAGAALVLPVALSQAAAAGRSRAWLLGAGLTAGGVSLATTKFPTSLRDGWGKTIVETVVWMMHLFGGATWIGGLAGLLLLALPGAVPQGDRGAFWAAAIRRFSVLAMSSVGAITLSGLFLYWEHVDGPQQLLTTMYGRVLGVKILIFGALLLLGMTNQFWLHPRIEALRASGDRRSLHAILARRFPAIVAVELLLGMTVLFVAPFLSGSARNEAYQAQPAVYESAPAGSLPKLAPKQASASTWAWGTGETIAVAAVMIAGYRVSGRLARRHGAATPKSSP